MRLRRKDYKYSTIDGIGDIQFRKSDKAKRVIISIKTSNSITVTVPRFISFKKTESFVIAKKDWIKKHQVSIDNKFDISSRFDTITSNQKQSLINRTTFLANKYGFEFDKLTIKKMTSRWGSCSNKNNISLNLGLALLPKNLQDYVILHELVHTKIKDHSVKFWDELNKLMPNAKKLNRQLNKNYRL